MALMGKLILRSFLFPGKSYPNRPCSVCTLEL